MTHYRITPERDRPDGWYVADAFGIPVVIQPQHLILPLLIFLQIGDPMTAALCYLVVFLSVLAHELGHGLAAKAAGCRRVFISFGAFFGLTHHESTTRTRHLLIVLAGPATSFAVGAVAFAISAAGLNLGNPEAAGLVLGLAIYVNLFWTLFNVLPIYPLDGGQALFHGLRHWKDDAWSLLFVVRVSMIVAIPVTWWLYTSGYRFTILIMGYMFVENFRIWTAYSNR